MALNFPSSPTDGQLYASGNITYSYSTSASAWLVVYPFAGLAANSTDHQILYNDAGNFTGVPAFLYYKSSDLLQANNLTVKSNVTANYYFGDATYMTNTATPIFTQSNAQFAVINVAYAQANTGRDHANTGYDQANTARSQANTGRIHANASFEMANAGYNQANTARVHSNNAYFEANSVNTRANAIGVASNTWANTQGQYSNVYAQTIFHYANTKFLANNSSNVWNLNGIVNLNGNVNISNNFVVSLNNAATLNLPGEIAEFGHDANGYVQVHIKNANTGRIASADLVVTADVGTDIADFIDLGINNSGYNDAAWTINNQRDGYFYASSQNLAIGVANTNRFIQFFTGGTLAANERLRIDPSGNLIIGKTSSVMGSSVKLDVDGAINASALFAIGWANVASINTTSNISQFGTTLYLRSNGDMWLSGNLILL